MNEILIYGQIGTWEISALSIREQLKPMNGDVIIKIDSPGGSVFEGISIFNAIKEYDKGTVTIIVESLAASIASYIALAGDVIKVHDNSTFMIHNAWTFTYGDGNELRKTADILDGLTSLIAKKYISKTGKTKEEIKLAMDVESYYFGSEILDYGFCDEVISTEEENTKDETLALSKESFKACCKTVSEKYSGDEFVQAVAKLTKEGVLVAVEDKEIEVVVDSTKQMQRARELQILKMEYNYEN
jgi:ATP-dependent Clp protease, protease subunit